MCNKAGYSRHLISRSYPSFFAPYNPIVEVCKTIIYPICLTLIFEEVEPCIRVLIFYATLNDKKPILKLIKISLTKKIKNNTNTICRKKHIYRF